MCPAIDSNFGFVSDMHWNSAYYSAMAAISTAAEAVQKKTENLALPVRFWRLERSVREVLEILENPPKSSSTSCSSAEPVDIHKALEQFDSFLEALDKFQKACRRAGYTNRTLTAGSLRAIAKHAAAISDFTERVKMIIDPETDAIFQRAREDRMAHGTVPMSSVF